MSNSEKSEDAGKKQSRYVTWAVLIGVGLVWWFYPQIRAAVQPATGEIAGTKTVEFAKLSVVENEAVAPVVIETPIMDEGQTELLADIETEYLAPTTDKSVAVEPSSSVVLTQEMIMIPLELDETAVVGIKDKSQAPISVEVETASDSVDELAVGLAPIAPQPKINDVALPRFDLVRIEDDGSALIAGLAAGTGHVILSVDGIELPRARSDLNGSGQFVIFAFLPPKITPQALKLHLYTEGVDGVVISDEIVFVAAAPQTENQEKLVASLPEDIGEIDPQPESVMQTEVSAVSATTKVLLVDETGVKILQDSEEMGPFIIVSIDTISYNLKGDVSIGGRATGRGFVRIYLNNRAITTSQISDSGYWTVDLLNVEAGIYTLRVDELNSVGNILSRSEIPFKREEPAELAALMAETDKVVVDDAALAETVAAASDTLKVEVAAEVQQELEITQTVVEVQAQVDDLAASTSGIGFDVEASGANSKGVGAEPAELDASLRAPSAIFRVKTVQPGSTLWAIAKESYGAGIEYFKVFDANKERIRDPDLIYPGQVFEIPD
tara:strand:- start:639 stop:2300 length:1662 start_codon:yes stop_codon:yes gene_type:complete